MSSNVAPSPKPTSGRFGPVLKSEWTKFRTIRGWTIGLIIALFLTVTFSLVVANGNHEGGCNGAPPAGSGANSPGTDCYTGHPYVPTGPDGNAVADTYEYFDQPLTGNGTLTAEITDFTGLTASGPSDVAPSLAHTRSGLAAWSKAGILVTTSTRQGSSYAAVMATSDHGIRFQYNYTHDIAGAPDVITKTSPAWLRLSRDGDTVTGYESANGTTWTAVGATHLGGLPTVVTIGLFVTSPSSVTASASLTPTQATATFGRFSLTARGATHAWESHSVGTSSHDFYPTLGDGKALRSGNTVVVSGSGDIAAAVNPLAGGSSPSDTLWFGMLVALLIVSVVSALFITVEYRRGLIRATFTATPRRGFVLAAKALIIGGLTFVTGAIAAAISVPISDGILIANGNYVFPTNAFTLTQTIAGSGAMLALSAVTVLALGTILRSTAGAVVAGVAVFVLPYALGRFVTGSAQEWIFRLSPAAGFSLLGTNPQSSFVASAYTFANGYYPLAPWAGLLVLCAYAGVALIVASVLVRRRDA